VILGLFLFGTLVRECIEKGFPFNSVVNLPGTLTQNRL
jgi:hypothetical protein